jgi:hypothetical protein
MADTEDQAHLPGTDYAKVKFVGMAWELVDVPQLRDEITFKVTGFDDAGDFDLAPSWPSARRS